MLLLAGCGAQPQRAVGVAPGPTVHYLLCAGDTVERVRVTALDGRVLWQRSFPQGTTLTLFHLPPLRPPFRVSGPDGRAAMQVDALPASGILRGDGRQMTAARFQRERRGYCGAARQDRAAALAVGFVLLGLAAVFTTRWLRARRSRDPYDRGYR